MWVKSNEDCFFNRAPIKALKRHYRADARNQGELRNELGILEVSGANQGFCSECIRCWWRNFTIFSCQIIIQSALEVNLITIKETLSFNFYLGLISADLSSTRVRSTSARRIQSWAVTSNRKYSVLTAVSFMGLTDEAKKSTLVSFGSQIQIFI